MERASVDRLACFGLTRHPNTADFAGSVALETALELARTFPGKIWATDPFAAVLKDSPPATDLRIVKPNQALELCDGIVLMVAHAAFAGFLPTHKPLLDLTNPPT